MQKNVEENQLLQRQNSELQEKLKNQQSLIEDLEKLKAQNVNYSEEKQSIIE